jgi:serine/threonine-protein kinase
MPYEQSAGRPVFASDIYALGLTAIYLLTGKYPQQLINKQTGQFEWRSYLPMISSGFADILDKAVCDRFHERYLTAKEMLEAIKALEPQNEGGTTVYEAKKFEIEASKKNLLKWKIATLIVSILTIISGLGMIYLSWQKQQDQSLISQLQNDLNAVENKLETANTEINKLNATIDDLSQGQSNVEELAKKIATLENQVQTLQTENTRINNQNKSLQSENQKLTTRIEELQTTKPSPSPTNTGKWGGRCGSAAGVQSDTWYKVTGEKDAYARVKQLCPQDQPYKTSDKVVVASVTSRSEANDLARRLKAKTGYNFWVE